MSDYSEHYKDMKHEALLRRWTPEGLGDTPATPENLRFNIAKRRAAEYELREIKNALHTLKEALR